MEHHSSKKLVEWGIYAIVFGTGIIRAYTGSAFNSFLAQLVPTASLVRAVSVNSMVWLIAATTGPVLAGLLMGYTNITIAFCPCLHTDQHCFFSFPRITPKPVSWQQGNSKTWEAVKEGLNFVFRQKALLGAMTLDMFAVLFGGATALLPVFAIDILKVGPQGLGWLVAATYLGNFIAIAWTHQAPVKKKQGNVHLFYMVAGFGLCILLFCHFKKFLVEFCGLVYQRFI